MDSLEISGEFEFLAALLRHDVQFMVAGASAAVLIGVPLVTQDIDLWFENCAGANVKKALNDVDGIYVPPLQGYPPTFAGASVKFFDIVINPQGLNSFAAEFPNAVAVPLGKIIVPVLPLSRVIESKKAAGRAKDKAALPALENAARIISMKTSYPLWRDVQRSK